MGTGQRGRESKSEKKTASQRAIAKESQSSETFQPERLGNSEMLPDFPPAYPNNLRLRQRAMLHLQRKHGNAHVQRLLANQRTRPALPVSSGNAPDNLVQRDKAKGGGKSKGEGPGKIKGAKETFYNVSGKKLSDLTNQLKKFDGYASETYVAITIDGEVTPKRKSGKLQIKVKWKAVDHETKLPRWTDYKDACSAAQDEWDRFLKQTRKHEEKAHVKMANNWVKKLGKKDTVITGKDVNELKKKLEAKQKELGKKLQAKHNACGHGVDIDAILHPEKGACG